MNKRTHQNGFTLIELLACQPKPGAQRRRRQARAAFTLIELLVVIAILAILAALLFPSLAGSIEEAKAAACRSNLRQVGMALITFASDNDGHLPGVDDIRGSEPWGQWWVGDEVLTDGYTGTAKWSPTEPGVLQPYLGTTGEEGSNVLRCPSLRPGDLNDGLRSNGMFDYAMIKAFAGALLSVLPSSSVLYRDTSYEQRLATPLVVEEDPEFYSNNGWIDTGHNYNDRLGSWHNGKGHYVSIAGNIVTFDAADSPDGLGPQVRDWSFMINEQVATFWEDGIPFGSWYSFAR